MSSKQCFKCYKVLPLSAFYKHREMGDGHLNKCKECNKKDSTKHRNDNIEKVRKYDRGRGFRGTKGKVYGMNREPAKGKCFFCGSGLKLEKHHPDYNNPTFVVTLCRKCHRNVHTIIKIDRRGIRDLTRNYVKGISK